MPVTTASEYKAHAGIDGNTDDTYIGELCLWVQDEAESFIGYTLDGAERTEDYDGGGGQQIILKARPVVSITSLTPLGADSVLGTAWASTDYKVDLDTGILSLTPRQVGRFPVDDFGVVELSGEFDVTPRFEDQFRNVRVVYKAGWGGGAPYTDAPRRLKMKFWKVIDAAYRSRAIATGSADGELADVIAVLREQMFEFKRHHP